MKQIELKLLNASSEIYLYWNRIKKMK